MKNIHSITLSVFIKPEEDFEKNKNIFLSFFPFSIEEQKILITEMIATSFEERQIKILEVILEKQKHTTLFLQSLLERLAPEQKQLLLRQRNSRVDDYCCFFIRFDKERLLESNTLFITDSGHCFHLKIHLACYPAKRENAFLILEELFKT
ncbi:hypothetical protein J4410_00495 [Candidatus Woesearchaeota archaeon]|nr:hypothetical protein [Candidatus Woesearchaeota archaeon]